MPRLIDADALIGHMRNNYGCDECKVRNCKYDCIVAMVIDDVKDAPTVDAVEVVRCKDCVHYWKNEAETVCLASPRDDAYCSEGERKEDE